MSEREREGEGSRKGKERESLTIDSCAWNLLSHPIIMSMYLMTSSDGERKIDK